MSQSLTVNFLGAAGTVTGSKTLLEYNGKRYLVDCGLFQGPFELRELNWNSFGGAEKLDGVILTHAHIDHSGYLPKLYKEGFRGPIYSTPATADLCEVMLMDSAYLQEEDARFANQTRHSHHNPAIPLYTAADAKGVLPQFFRHPYHEWKILQPGLSFRFFRAGHILGSAFVQIAFETPSGIKFITFSGDLGNGRSLILEDPEYLRETDFLVLESTYGDRLQDRSDPRDRLSGIINRVIMRGGTLIVPAFSVGRSQELLYLVSDLMETKKIESVPIYLDSPMSERATELYLKNHDELKKGINGSSVESKLSQARFKVTKTADESMLLCMSDEPKIVISAAGMLTGGRVLHHLKAKLPHEKNGVLFVGFQVEGSKGHLLKNGLRKIRLHHQNVDVEAEVFSMDNLSAHADSDDLINWISQIKSKPQMIYLNHGQPAACHALAYRIDHELGLPSLVVAMEQEIVLT